MRVSRRTAIGACLAAGFGVTGRASAAARGRFEPIALDSPVLGRPLHANVWLPPGLDSADGPVPSLYLLHGARGNERSWPMAARFWAIVEGMIEAGTLPRFIAVCPGNFAGWWCDGPEGAMEQALVQDLIPAIGRDFPVVNGRAGRAIAGISAGGFGSLRLLLRYPHLFGAATLWAPATYVDGPPERSAARMDAPFRGPDGTFSRAVWDGLNWPSLLPGYLAQPLRVPMFIASGDHDPLNIALEAARLFATIWPQQREEAELRVVDGDHSDKVWEATCESALGFMFGHLQRLAALPTE